MKRNVLLFLFLTSLPLFSQTTPTIAGYGETYTVESDNVLLLDTTTTYKVIFDVYTDASKGKDVNPLLNAVARYINMHTGQGVPLEHLSTVVVLHGAATPTALSNTDYETIFERENPNAGLVKALKESGVAIYVCGQSFKARGYQENQRSNHVSMSLSALTALVKYQSEGYQLITFN